MSSSFAAIAPIPEGQASEATYAFTSDVPAPSSPIVQLNEAVRSSPPIISGPVPTRPKRRRLDSGRLSISETATDQLEEHVSNTTEGRLDYYTHSDEISPVLRPAERQAYVDIMDMIRKKRLSIKSFLIGYVTDYRAVDTAKSDRAHSVRKGAHMKRLCTLRDALNHPIVINQLASITPSKNQFPDKNTAEHLICVGNELKTLLSNPHFSQWTDGDNTFPDIDGAYAAIQEACPLWTSMLEILVRNPASSSLQNEDESGDEQGVEGNKSDRKYRNTIFLITSILLRSRHAKKANKPGMKLALYLHGLGTKRRALQSLSSMGLIPSYPTIERCIRRLVQEGEDSLAKKGQDPRVYIAVDNLDVQDQVRDQVTGSTRTTHHMTTGLAIMNPAIPRKGHLQSEFDRSKPLDYRSIAAAAICTRGTLGAKMEEFFIWRALDGAFGKGLLDKQCKKWGTSRLKPFQRTVRQVSVTDFRPLKGMYINSGTSDGNAQVHEAVFLDQFQYKMDSSIFRNELRILVGDQKTVVMSRKHQLSQQESASPFHRRNWMLVVPALFHVLMNYAQGVMIRTHWAPTRSTESNAQDLQSPDTTYSFHTIQSDSMLLQYQNISATTLHFQHIDALEETSFLSRILAVFICNLQTAGYLDRRLPAAEEICSAITSMSKDEFRAVIQTTREMLFSKDAWNAKFRREGERELRDQSRSFTTMCRLVQQLYIYFTFRQAIRYGDVDTIHALIPMLAILFYGSGKRAYGDEMLYLYWILQKDVSSYKLRTTIKQALIIKQRENGNWTGVDHAVELHNCACKIDLKLHKNSQHTVATSVQDLALTAPFMKQLRKNLESSYGIRYYPEHTQKDKGKDLVDLALRLIRDNRVNQEVESEKAEAREFLSEDVLQTGLDMLFNKVKAHNQRNMINTDTGLVDDALLSDDDDVDVDENAILTGFTEGDLEETVLYRGEGSSQRALIGE